MIIGEFKVYMIVSILFINKSKIEEKKGHNMSADFFPYLLTCLVYYISYDVKLVLDDWQKLVIQYKYNISITVSSVLFLGDFVTRVNIDCVCMYIK